jgi:hypothetical protein
MAITAKPLVLTSDWERRNETLRSNRLTCLECLECELIEGAFLRHNMQRT